MQAEWVNTTKFQSKSYTCGFCGFSVASNSGYHSNRVLPDSGHPGLLYLCSHCERPTFYHGIYVYPEPRFGENVNHVPPSITNIYDETRDCIKVGAYTASVLLSRKILMNLAVSHGAEAGESFADYVKFFLDKQMVPGNAKDWVDHIRQKGNEATHEIADMTREDAEELITFVHMLLKLAYEFPAMVPKKAKPAAS